MLPYCRFIQSKKDKSQLHLQCHIRVSPDEEIGIYERVPSESFLNRFTRVLAGSSSDGFDTMLNDLRRVCDTSECFVRCEDISDCRSAFSLECEKNDCNMRLGGINFKGTLRLNFDAVRFDRSVELNFVSDSYVERPENTQSFQNVNLSDFFHIQF
jgi:hypothetical protein